MKITFYLSKDPLEPFMNIVMPIMYCAIANSLNYAFFFNREDKPDFVANALTLGLTLVFLIPTISGGNTTTKNEFDMNELIIFFLFVGLIIGTIPLPDGHGGPPGGGGGGGGAPDPSGELGRRLQEHTRVKVVGEDEEYRIGYFYYGTRHGETWAPLLVVYLSNFFMHIAWVIPFINMYNYHRLKNALQDKKPTADEHNFNGRPNKEKTNVKGHEVVLERMAPFWKLVKDDKGNETAQLNDAINAKHKKDKKDLGPKKKERICWKAEMKKGTGSVSQVYAGMRHKDVFGRELGKKTRYSIAKQAQKAKKELLKLHPSMANLLGEEG